MACRSSQRIVNFAQHLRCCCDQEKQMKLAGTKPTAAAQNAQSQPTTKEPFSFDDGLCHWSFICLPHLFSVLALSMQLPQLLELPSIHTIHLSSSYITLKYTFSSSFQYTSKLNSQCFTNILICLFYAFFFVSMDRRSSCCTVEFWHVSHISTSQHIHVCA